MLVQRHVCFLTRSKFIHHPESSFSSTFQDLVRCGCASTLS